MGTTTAGVRASDISVHDRRAKDLGRQAEVASIEVPDPYDPNATITVLRQTKGDPLARLHAHRQIDDAQYLAGRRYQRDRELAERGPKAIDPTKEAVDGGQLPEPITDSQIAATARLVRVHALLGHRTTAALEGFLVAGMHVELMATQMFNRHGDRWANYYGRQVRDALEVLAMEYNLVGRR